MFNLTVKELLAKKLRLLTTALAVMLGVAFMAGTLVLTDTMNRTFDGLLSNAYAGTDAYVRGVSELDAGTGQAPRLDQSVVESLDDRHQNGLPLRLHDRHQTRLLLHVLRADEPYLR